MYYLIIFWILAVLFSVTYLLAKKYDWGVVLAVYDDVGILFILVLGSFLVMAIATNDPITILGITIPMELQWLASLFATGFGAWQFYLRPLKGKVYTMDRELGEIKTGMESVKSDVHLIKEKILNGKIKIAK